MKRILLFASLLPSLLSAQTAHIRELRFVPNPRYNNTADTAIVYPVVTTGNPTVDRRINKDIRHALLEGYDSCKTARDALRRWIGDGLTDMYYQVTYNKNGILSLLFDVGAFAAYEATWQTSLNFDLRTGHKLALTDLIGEARWAGWKVRVLGDKVDSLNRYKGTDLASGLKTKYLDTVTYNDVVGLLDDCAASLDTDDFSISADGIEVLDPCEFPHVIRGLSPTYTLKYSFRFLQPYLKPEYRRRLTTDSPSGAGKSA